MTQHDIIFPPSALSVASRIGPFTNVTEARAVARALVPAHVLVDIAIAPHSGSTVSGNAITIEVVRSAEPGYPRSVGPFLDRQQADRARDAMVAFGRRGDTYRLGGAVLGEAA